MNSNYSSKEGEEEEEGFTRITTMSYKIDSVVSSLGTPRAILSTTNEIGQDVGVIILALMGRWAIYVTVIAITLIIFALITKFMRDCECEVIRVEQLPASETNRLLSKDVNYLKYGTCEEDDDLEARKCTSEDLYDGKICVICYDHQRTCFFLPCGHFIACYICAQRIIGGKSKTCPICRRLIHKVGKSFGL